MKKAFITGITGLLGTNLAIQLLEQGWQVKGLLRNKKAYTGIDHPNLELITGNLVDDWDLMGVDVCIHVAAETNQSLLRYADYQGINCTATQHLLQRCIVGKVKKFIFVSTANTLGFGTLTDLGNENRPMTYPFTASLYAKSKMEAENYLLSQADKIDVVIINPTFMLGAYDNKPSSGRIILMGWKKNIIFYPPGGKNFVAVKDVAQGIINSIERGENRERYLIANDNLSYEAFFERLNRLTNQRPIMIKVPKIIWRALGWLGDMARFLGLRTSLSSANMRALCINNYFSNEKSKRALALQYRPVEEAIEEAIGYFVQRQNKDKK